MKATLIRPSKGKNPNFSHEEYCRAKEARAPYHEKPFCPIPVGTVINHREAWMLVKNGDAVPADEECRDAVRMSDEQLVKSIARQELLVQGRATGDPQADASRKPSQVQLPEEWSHLRDAVVAEIEAQQNRIDRLHGEARDAEEQEKAEAATVVVLQADDLPPEEDDLPPEE